LSFDRWKIFIIVLGILGLFIFGYYGGSFTGRVVQTNCYDEEVCKNVTLEKCFESECEEICENVTVEECFIEDVLVCEEICEEVCSEIGNETVCSEGCEQVCEEVSNETCEDSVVQNCTEVCFGLNCSSDLEYVCSIETVCEDVVVEEPQDKKEIIEVRKERALDEVSTFKEISVFNLTDVERSDLSKITGVEDVFVSVVGDIAGRYVVKFQMGDYWIEKSYDDDLVNFEERMEQDKNIWMRRILEVER
jgi:hypothetical protein